MPFRLRAGLFVCFGPGLVGRSDSLSGKSRTAAKRSGTCAQQRTDRTPYRAGPQRGEHRLSESDHRRDDPARGQARGDRRARRTELRCWWTQRATQLRLLRPVLDPFLEERPGRLSIPRLPNPTFDPAPDGLEADPPPCAQYRLAPQRYRTGAAFCRAKQTLEPSGRFGPRTLVAHTGRVREPDVGLENPHG